MWSDDANDITSSMGSNQFLAKVARYSGLDNCVKRSERQAAGLLPDRTLKTVTAAIIGAVWRDSDRDYDATRAIINKLGYVADDDMNTNLKLTLEDSIVG